MALVGEHGTFIHIPKCGGMSQRMRLDGEESGTIHGIPLEIEHPVFALVRHPVYWYRSVWAYLEQFDWVLTETSPPMWYFLRGCLLPYRSPWGRFVDLVTTEKEGFYGEILRLCYEFPWVEFRRLEDQDYLPWLHETPNLPGLESREIDRIQGAERLMMMRYGYERLK